MASPARAASRPALAATVILRKSDYRFCSIGIFDIGDRTIAAGSGLGMPATFFVLVLDCLRVTGYALLGRGRARRGKRRLVSGKRLRENTVDRVGPALVVPDDPICDMRHGCTCW